MDGTIVRRTIPAPGGGLRYYVGQGLGNLHQPQVHRETTASSNVVHGKILLLKGLVILFVNETAEEPEVSHGPGGVVEILWTAAINPAAVEHVVNVQVSDHCESWADLCVTVAAGSQSRLDRLKEIETQIKAYLVVTETGFS